MVSYMACAVHNTHSTSLQNLPFGCGDQGIPPSTRKVSASLRLAGNNIDTNKTPEKSISDYIVTAVRNVTISLFINLLSFILTVAFFLQGNEMPGSIDYQSSTIDCHDEGAAKETLKKLAEKLKESSGNVSASVIKDKLAKLGLINSDGKWYSDKIKMLGEKLLSDVDGEFVSNFIDSAVNAAEANSYLMSAVSEIMNRHNDTDNTTEYLKEIPDLIGFAIVLNELTQAQANDIDILEDCLKCWHEQRMANGGVLKSLGLCGAIKMWSVEKPIEESLKYRKADKITHDFAKWILPINILEACFFDILNGNFDNALAGIRLAKNYPGKYAERCAELDHKGHIHVNLPEPKLWADLYGSWNMAFVSQLVSMPLYMIKLLVPAVNDYKDSPKEYICLRAFALKATLEYLAVLKEEEKECTPLPKSMTRAWGGANRCAAVAYQDEVDKAPAHQFPDGVGA